MGIGLIARPDSGRTIPIHTVPRRPHAHRATPPAAITTWLALMFADAQLYRTVSIRRGGQYEQFKHLANAAGFTHDFGLAPQASATYQQVSAQHDAVLRLNFTFCHRPRVASHPGPHVEILIRASRTRRLLGKAVVRMTAPWSGRTRALFGHSQPLSAA